MNPELISVVKERVDLGHSDESIKEELIKAGYSEEIIDEIIDTARHGGDYAISAIPQEAMPSATELISRSFSYIFKRYDLLLLLASPLVLISLLEYLDSFIDSEQLALKTVFSLVAILSIVGYFIVFISTLYIVSFSNDREVSFNEALSWTVKNIWGFIFINVLTTLVIIGGLTLLIVPGIIISVYIYFSQFIFAIEGKKGMEALLRSGDLVKGNWLKVAGRVVLVYMLLFLLFMILGAIGALLISFAPDGAEIDFVTAVLMQVMSALVSMVGLLIGVEMYRWLIVSNPSDSEKVEKGKVTYIALATAGFLSVLLVISSFIYLYSVHGEEYFQTSYRERLNLDTEELDASAKERALELRMESPAGEDDNLNQ